MVTYSLSDFGSYTVSGRVIEVTEGETREVSFTRSAKYTYDPRGHFAVEQAYVQYFVPAIRNDAPPIVLVHGGGMHGGTWETTPDGRPGWLNLLVAQGYEVHVLDNVERGRSGFTPNLWQGDPILRSLEEAWTLFRIGRPENYASRTPFARSQFPVEAFDAFAQMMVPRWLTTTPLHVNALVAVLKRVGPAVVMCHSQGGEIALDAARRVPELFAGYIGIEPSTTLDDPQILKDIPTVIFSGDYLDCAPHWLTRRHVWESWVASMTRNGFPARLVSVPDVQTGHSHCPMFDSNSAQCLATILSAFEETTYRMA
ncbi:MAG: alpha/beta fold hydrolase [Paracoccaceae bacterium]